MATTDPRHEASPPPERKPRTEEDPGQSAERERQEESIKRASREPWISQLLRTLRLSKGRPKPRDDKASPTR